MKKQVPVWLVNDYWWDDHYPSNLVDFVEWANGLLASVPKEHKKAAQVRVESDADSSSVHFSVCYSRDETDEEEKARKAEERSYKAEQTARELAEFQRLKAKFEKGGA